MKKISFSLLLIALFAVISFSCSNVSEGGGSEGGGVYMEFTQGSFGKSALG